MADIRLAKPAAGAAETAPCAPEARFIFDFPATDATLARDGDNLAIQFEDGSRLNLEGFYTEYNEENLPSFSIDGTEVAAADFFAAMNEPDLMPAAGPGAGTPTGGRFHEWGNASLAAGLDHLDGLDLTGGRAFSFDDALNAVGGAPEGEYAALAGAAAPGTTPAPDNPVIITLDVNGGQHILQEKHLQDGSAADPTRTSAEGTLHIDALDGVAQITVGGAIVWDNGALQQRGIEIPGGKLNILGFNEDTGKLTYCFELEKRVDHLDNEGESLFHDFTVTVMDTNGSDATSTLRLTIEDDAPKIDSIELADGVRDSGRTITGTFKGLDLGADDTDAAKLEIVVGHNGDEPETFTFTRTQDGSWEPTIKGQALQLNDAQDGFIYTRPDGHLGKAADTYSFTARVTDADNDVAPTDTVTVTTSFAEPTIIYNDQATSSQVTVDEGDLAHGSGHDPTDATKAFTATSNGSFTVDLDSADGVITIDDAQFSITDGTLPEPQDVTIEGEFGRITSVSFSPIDDSSKIKVDYTYELTKRTESGTEGRDGQAGRGESGGGDSFVISVKTSAGNNEGSINVSVLDDAPHVDNKIDFNNLRGNTSFYDTDTTITFQIGGGQGNAVKLDNVNFGADVTSETGEKSAFVLVTVEKTRAGASFGQSYSYKATVTRDENGELHIGEFTQDQSEATLSYNQETGIFSFTPAGGLEAGSSYKATIRIEDADGDFTEITESTTVVATPDNLPESVSVMVSEAGLHNGSQNYPEVAGQAITEKAGLFKLPEGWKLQGEAKGEQGCVEQAQDGSLQYVLTDKLAHSKQGQDQKTDGDTVTLTLTGPQGQTHEVTVKVDIYDDIPVIGGDKEVSVVSTTETLFPEGTFDFTFGNHDEFARHDNEVLGSAGAGWKICGGADGAAPSAEHSSGLHVSGWIYTYTEENGQRFLNPGDKPLQVLYSNSDAKIDDKGKVTEGLQDGLTVGDSYNTNDGSYSSLEIGAKPGTNQAEGLCFDLGGKIAHSVTVDLGAFFCAGSQNDAGYKYDPISERALLTFYDKKGNIVKQMEVQADSLDGQYTTQSIDCYIAGGFSSFVVSALDNTEGMANPPANADSDFVVQSVEFHKIIGTASGKLDVKPGADGWNKDMHGYAALFDLAAMKKEYTTLAFEEDGMNGFIAKDGDETIFAASIDKNGNWTLTQFNYSKTSDITLHFLTKDGDGDISTEPVTTVHLNPENDAQVVQDFSVYAAATAYDDGNDVLFGDGDNTSAEQLAEAIDSLQWENVDAKADALVTAMKKITGEEPEKFDALGKAIDEKFSGGDAEEDGNDKLYGGNGDDVLLGMGGDDRLMGNAGDDYLFGGSGNYYLHGGEGKDYLNGDAGSDLLVYDAEDYLIDGGAGLDILLAGSKVADTLDSLLESGKVTGVEVLLKGTSDDALLNLTNMQELADKYGIRMGDHGNSLTLTMTGDSKNGWTDKGNGVYEHRGDDGNVDLTMETANLTVQEPASSETEQATLTLTLAQG